MKFKKIYLVLLFSIFVQIFLQTSISYLPYWDSAVYVGQGKFMFSGGKSGGWEALRPPLWPMFLGLVWKLGLDPVFFGHVFVLMFSLSAVYLVYLIGKEIGDERGGIISSIVFASFPLFQHFTLFLLTEIPVIALSLTSIYLLIKGKPLLSGIFAGLSVLMKFTEFGIVIALLAWLLTKKDVKKMLIFCLGGVLVGMPYLISNYILYKTFVFDAYSLVLPFHRYFLAVTKGTPWLFESSRLFYFREILFHHSVLFVGFIGLVRLKVKKAHPVMIAFLVYFVFFALLSSHNQDRYILLFAPYLAILTGVVIQPLKKNQQVVFLLFVVFSSGFGWNHSFRSVQVVDPDGDILSDYLFFENTTGKVLTSDPTYMLYSDALFIPGYTIDRFNMSYLKEKDTLCCVVFVPDNIVSQDAIFSPEKTAEEYITEEPVREAELLDGLRKDFKREILFDHYGRKTHIFLN